MDSKFYTETYTYREGRILIYKRPNSKNFQCRLRIEGIKGYIIKSCDTVNQGKALKFAEDLYDNLRFKKLNNLPLKTKTFEQIYDEWFKKADKSIYRREFYQSRSKLYLIPYFGKYNIEEITSNVIEDYWSWRKNYYKANPDKAVGRAAVVPSPLSLRMEKTIINEVLGYAQRRGYIRVVPAITFTPKIKIERRDTFTEDEYNKVISSLKSWSMHAKKASDKYQRKMIYNLVVFLANSGIRANEFYKIKWKNLEIHNQNGIKTLYITISEHNKTGRRVVVGLPEVYEVYNNIMSFSKYTGEDDFIFTNFDGTPMINWGRTYTNFLKSINLYLSDDGKPRPPYSLRHYYATRRLMEGVNVYDLARNMGTSVKQIENHYGHILSTQKSAELMRGAKKSFHQQKEEFIDDMGFEVIQHELSKIENGSSVEKEKLKQWKEKMKDKITSKDKELFRELVEKY